MSGKKGGAPAEARGMKRKAKDSLFTAMFSERGYLLMLYRSLHPEDSAATEADLHDVTLHPVLTDDIYNDLGFMVSDRLVVLVEAQSTWSPNIVLRAFMYLVKTYNEYLRSHGLNVYGGAAVRLPRPELYVLYTGEREECPDYLSFREVFFPREECAVDVRVKVLRDGRPGDIISQYVAFTRELDGQQRKHGRTRFAVEETIRICTERDILKEYLESRRSEVMDYIWDMTNEEIQAIYEKEKERKYKAEVVKEYSRNTARRLIAKGQMSHADIAECSGLPLEEVEALAGLELA